MKVIGRILFIPVAIFMVIFLLIEFDIYFFLWFFTGVDPSDRDFITQEVGQKIYEKLIGN